MIVTKEVIVLLSSDIFHPEFLDFMKIVEFGAKKYAMNNWLEEDGKCSDHKSMHDSMFHHLALSFSHKRLDNGAGGSGLDHLLHLITRATMYYTRLQRDIVHDLDKQGDSNVKTI